MAGPSARRTPLYERHVAAGARMVDFAGWAMPVHYAPGIRDEHLAVRDHAGIFDVSHMGQLELSPDLAQRLLSNDVATVPVGGSQYSVVCDENGGVIDDVLAYRIAADRLLVVTNAANHAVDLQWLGRHGPVADRAADHAMLAVQGPRAREIVQAIADRPLPTRRALATHTLAGVPTLVAGTGYTGEDGVELLVAPDRAVTLWDEIVARGAAPAGLGARDTLRLEACLPLHGNELSRERGPIEAGLGWCCKEDTHFVGAEKVREARGADARGELQRLVPFTLGEGIPRAGCAVLGGGVVTSGTLSPSLGIGIGLAYVPAERSEIGTILHIDVRGRVREGTVSARPLVRPRR